MGVYLYPSGTETELKNAYIGEYGWKPNANTIAYYPLTSASQGNDMKGFGTAYNLSSYKQAPTYGTNAGVSCANFTSAMLINTSASIQVANGVTMSSWAYKATSNGAIGGIMTATNPDNQGNDNTIAQDRRSNDTFGVYMEKINQSAIGGSLSSGWDNLIYTYDGSTLRLYINGTASTTFSYTDTDTKSTIYLGWRGYNNQSFKGYLSEVIFENKARTAQEVLNYYNSTKGKYGIS